MNPKMKILLVDDFSTMRRIIKNLLKQIGYENIEEAEDGAQAYSKLKSGEFDFIICDLEMPNMNGLELLSRIRSEIQFKDSPFLMIISHTAEYTVKEIIHSAALPDALSQVMLSGFMSEAQDYIVRPFRGEMLKEKIDKILEAVQK